MKLRSSGGAAGGTMGMVYSNPMKASSPHSNATGARRRLKMPATTATDHHSGLAMPLWRWRCRNGWVLFPARRRALVWPFAAAAASASGGVELVLGGMSREAERVVGWLRGLR